MSFVCAAFAPKTMHANRLSLARCQLQGLEMAHECTLVTAATLYSSPASHGTLAWSSDNVLAVGGDKSVALLHVAALRQGQQVVHAGGSAVPAAGSSHCAPYALGSLQHALRGCASWHWL